MVSNGLSSRRTTLKRPIVCKSKPTGDCGACELGVQKPPEPTGTNQVEPWILDLICNPDPSSPEFEIFVYGAFHPDLPLPTLTAGIPATCFLRSPGTVGTYGVKFSISNKDGCIFIRDTTIEVA